MAAAPSKPSATRLPYSTPVKSIILCTGIFKSQNVGISLHSTVDTYPGQSRSPVASFSGQLLSRLGLSDLQHRQKIFLNDYFSAIKGAGVAEGDGELLLPADIAGLVSNQGVDLRLTDLIKILK